MKRKTPLVAAVIGLLLLVVACSPSIESDELSGKRVAILIGEGIYSTGALEPARYLRARGASVTMVGLNGDPVAPYDTPNQHVRVNEVISEVDANEFDVLIIPGGAVPPFFGDRLAAEPEVLRLVREMVESERVVAAVCTGVQVLVRAGVVSGRTLTGHAMYADSVAASGGTWVEQQVIRDGHMITCRPTDCLDEFSKAIEEALMGID